MIEWMVDEICIDVYKLFPDIYWSFGFTSVIVLRLNKYIGLPFT